MRIDRIQRSRRAYLIIPRRLVVCLAACGSFALTSSAQAPASSACTPDTPIFSSPYCAELVAVPDLRGVRGAMELTPIVGPFGIAVDSAGRQRARLTLQIQGLPPVATLGAFSTYVAWAYSLTMDREHKLGEVRNGRTALGEAPVALMQFRVLVSAEPNAGVTTRGGKLVMRGSTAGGGQCAACSP